MLLVERLDQVVFDHAEGYNWHLAQTWRTRVALRVLLAMGEITTVPIRASDIARLHALAPGNPDLRSRPILTILAEADLLTEDRPSTLEVWF
ncbi:hypothetical protein ETD83_22540 [Actinomadura soli]|uniref:Uncharacterized protein n=1 Tax=Actinomadura soli TaxID=2508997 RepID=A0A5C4J8C1_9ACTN|nr:hypothetical protein [Actinomadura soli]TMQ95309.1 hypothetical protein ETD83_22540 [Actinomadura soli]